MLFVCGSSEMLLGKQTESYFVCCCFVNQRGEMTSIHCNYKAIFCMTFFIEIIIVLHYLRFLNINSADPAESEQK